MNNFAIGSAGVGEALKRSASAMYAANNTLEESIGLATAANTILQNPQSVGTTLKTVSMYIRAAKTELEEAGEDTEGIAESTGKLRELIKQITREGGKAVDIMADENRFKSTYQILEEISEVWDKISDTNQAALLEKLGGKRNANAIAAILENFDIARKAMETATNSEGSAMKELEKFQQSIEGHLVALKTAFQELSQTVIDSDLVKAFVDMGRYILEATTKVAKFVDAFGGISTIMYAFSGAMIAKNIGTITSKLEKMGDVLAKTNISFSDLKSLLAQLGKQGISTSAALGLVTAALVAANAAYQHYKQKQAERRAEAEKDAEAASEQGEELAELIRKYDELSEAVKTDDSAKQDLDDATSLLIKKLGVEEDAVKRLAGRYGNLTDAIREASTESLRKDRRDLQTDYNLSRDDLLNAAKPSAYDDSLSFINTNGSISFAEKAALDYFKNKGLIRGNVIYGAKTKSGYTKATFAPNFDLSTPEGVIEAYEKLGKMLDELDARHITDGALRESIANGYDQLSDAVDKNRIATERLNTNLLDTYYSETLLGKAVPETKEEFEDIRQETINQISAQNRFIGSTEELTAAVDDMLRSSGKFSQFYSEATDSISDSSNAISRSANTFAEYKSEIGKLGAALGEFQEQGNISSETYRDLIEANEKYNDLIEFTDNGIEIQTDKLNSYIESLEQEYGAKMAANGATSDEIGMMIALGNTLVTVSENTGDVASEITELRGYVDALNKGVEYSWDEIVKLTKKYPKLEDAIIDTEHGYRLEIDALEDLIAVKAEYIRLTDKELSVVQARNALNLKNSGNTTASVKIDEIFAKYKELNGKAITSLEEFKDAYAAAFGKAFEGAYEEYENYVDALISENKGLELAAKLAMNALENTAEGFDPDKIEDTTKAVDDLKSELDNLTDVMKKLNEGTEFSTSETITLLTKYPALRDHIIKTANGYKIETDAIKELIAAKVQLITTVDKEKSVAAARTALVSTTKDANADKADVVFANYLAKNGRNIETIEEYREAYKAYYGYAAKASIAYAQAKIDAFADAGMDAIMVDLYNDYVSEYMEGYTPEKTSSSGTDKEETAFEKAYKLHQHYLAMDQETVEQYLNWLDGAYKASYAIGEMELDDYYKYEEEVYEKRKELFSQHLDELQHQIDLLSHKTGDTSKEQIAIYEQMQRALNQKANEYRARGIKDNDELIRELQNQWWQYEENIRQLRESAFNDWLNDRKFVIEQLKLDNPGSDEIISSWKDVLVAINEEIAYYTAKGHDITSDEIQSLMKEAKSAKDAIISELEEIVSKANEVLDGFENVYKTLTGAAKEYAANGYLSADSLQSILSLGPKYLTMLYDENGQLTINKESLEKIIAARTDEMAAETALSYAKQILLATEQDEVNTLRELTQLETAAGSSAWEMAYATIGYARALGKAKGIGDEFYVDAINHVTKMQSLTNTAVNSISGWMAAQEDGYVSQAEGLETILKLTEDMIKQENSDRIKQLEDEKDIYKDIIDEKKEILRLSKEQADHDRDMADKLKEISDLQSRIDQLALDDSREARAQRSKLEEELLQKQKALADDQADYAYDAKVDALDKQYEEYEKEMDKETDALKDELNSAEKLYRAAIERINNGWDNLYNDLLNWNYNYGSTLEKDLTKAWTAALAAAERYGDFVSALDGVKEDNKLGAPSVTPASDTVMNAVNGGASKINDIIDRMRANSLAWFTATGAGQKDLEQANRDLAEEFRQMTGSNISYNNGSWFAGSSKLYSLDKDEVAKAIVSVMKQNSADWASANESKQRQLKEFNEMLAQRLSAYLGKPITKTSGGVWMIGDRKLFDVYHKGGIAGGSGTAKQNEVMALLEKGEAILDERRETALYKTVDFVEMLSEKIGKVIDAGRISSLLNGTGYSVSRNPIPALAGGIGTMNFSPTVNVTIAGGDLNESNARKYGNIAAESVLTQLKSAFSQRGISAAGNSILK